MAQRCEAPDPYLAEHLKEALTRDLPVGGLGIGVTLTGAHVVLTGEVSSPEQRDALESVARELMPNHDVRNETTVVELPEPEDSEAMP